MVAARGRGPPAKGSRPTPERLPEMIIKAMRKQDALTEELRVWLDSKHSESS